MLIIIMSSQVQNMKIFLMEIEWKISQNNQGLLNT